MPKKKKYHYVLVLTDNGPVFVTSVDNRYAKWERSDKPMELGDNYASSLAVGLTVNGNIALHVVLGYELTNHIIDYKHGEFTWHSFNNNDAPAEQPFRIQTKKFLIFLILPVAFGRIYYYISTRILFNRGATNV